MKKILNGRKRKLRFRQNRSLKTFGLLCLLVLTSLMYVQCSKETPMPSIDDVDVVASMRSANPILRMSYDSEVSTHFTVEGDLTNTMDIAAQTPTIVKSNIVLEVSSNGEVSIQMTKKTPSQTVEIPHLTLPSNSPEPHKTIIGGGKIQVFDEEDALIYSEDYSLPNAEDLVTLLQSLGEDYTSTVINDMLSQGQSNLFTSDLQTYLQQAVSNGVTVNHINNDFVALSRPLEPSNQDSDVAVSLVDKTNNRVVENRLYDAGDTWLSSIQFRYQEGETPTLKATLERTKTVLPSGLEATMQVYSTFENLSYEINL